MQVNIEKVVVDLDTLHLIMLIADAAIESDDLNKAYNSILEVWKKSDNSQLIDIGKGGHHIWVKRRGAEGRILLIH